VAKNWTGVIYTGASGTKLLNGGAFIVQKVTETEATAKVKKLSIDEIGDNYRVLLTQPPPSP
jgi:hypothetical protein